MSRDFPIPASPARSTTWPSPDFAFDQRRRSNSVSSSRPARAVKPVECIASNRLSTVVARNAAQARAGPAMPLRSLAPRSCSSNRFPRSLRVLSAMTTMLGSAVPCRRAARFGVSPTIPRSCESPEPIRSPTTTSPVAIPTRTCDGLAAVLSFGTASTRSSPARTARSASSSCACG